MPIGGAKGVLFLLFYYNVVGRVFPAPAGMNRLIAAICSVVMGVPRACGDEPFTMYYQYNPKKCSPRLRG